MPVDAISERLINEREDIQARAAGIKRTALEQNRDLNDADRGTLESFRTRVTAIDEQLKLTTESFELNETIAGNLARVNGGYTIRAENPWEKATPGQVLHDYLHRHQDPAAAARIESFNRLSTRAAQHLGTTAENTVAVAGGFGGILVSQIQGPIIDLNWQGMPLVSALGYTDLPTANTFMRPRLIDPEVDTAAGPQAGGKEKAELPSKKWDIVADPIGLAGVGNYINLSIQAETMIPGALDQVINQLNARTTRGIEKTALAILTATTNTIPLADDADAAALQAAIGQAYVAVWKATNTPPQWIAFGPEGAGRLIGYTDAAGRPLFPFLNPVNASATAAAVQGQGGTIAGLRPILTPGIDDDSYYVGNGYGLEVYLHRLPLLQAIEPSILGRQLAAAALVGTYQVPTKEAVTTPSPLPAEYKAVVKIGD
jgi:hypothetical protein